MLITLYKSSLCPRCYLARKSLLKLAKTNPIITITEIDVLTSPLVAWRENIKMIPAIKIGDQTLSSLYLSPRDIEDFVFRFLK